MRLALGAVLVVLGAGCAHSPEKAEPGPRQAARAQELSAQAEKSYRALDFPTCAEQFRQAAEASADADSRAESFYDAARCTALRGEAPQAIELLKRSVQSGYYDPDTFQFDPDLSSLHTVTGWDEVLAGAKANLAKAPNPPMPVGVLSGIDVYGSRRADPEAVRRQLGLELGKPLVHSFALFHQKEAALKKQYNLAFAQLSFIYFFASENAGKAFLTVDLVDAEDTQRLRFLPAPSGHPADPEGLVAQWRDYESHAEQLMRKGQIDMETQATCRVANCFFGFGHPALAHYEPVFVEKVPKEQDALVQVLREEEDGEKRAAAAFLLAYAATPEKGVQLLVPFIRDPDGGVRNNVLRVMIATQEKADHPLVDIATVVDALSMPQTSDRNKACYLLSYLLDDLKPEELQAQKAPLIRQLGEQLVTMAGMQQPINREPAVEVLQKLSGESYENPEQWKAWLARQPK
ncbi:MAG: HEAT repeat domain-containing protein [Hyalangium sp.]|uniref:HEAT repeat domain-containing protein n=1 Tax=Hyalangium sp. TaxID=2028555 RepID=UPI00389ABC1E